MVKFFCDRCGVEVENLDALLEFSIAVSERPNHLIWNWRAEVCHGCYATMKEEIGSRLVALPLSEETKKKPVRKVAS